MNFTNTASLLAIGVVITVIMQGVKQYFNVPKSLIKWVVLGAGAIAGLVLYFLSPGTLEYQNVWVAILAGVTAGFISMGQYDTADDLTKGNKKLQQKKVRKLRDDLKKLESDESVVDETETPKIKIRKDKDA